MAGDIPGADQRFLHDLSVWRFCQSAALYQSHAADGPGDGGYLCVCVFQVLRTLQPASEQTRLACGRRNAGNNQEAGGLEFGDWPAYCCGGGYRQEYVRLQTVR